MKMSSEINTKSKISLFLKLFSVVGIATLRDKNSN